MSSPLLPLIGRLSAQRVIVVGDAVLDIYTSGTSTRDMPEAPKPVVLAEARHVMLGGAGNVAANAAALGAEIDFICLTGEDAARAEMLALAQARYRLKTEGFIADASRPTICKERILANGAHVARVDTEKTHAIGGAAKEALLGFYEGALDKAGAVILSDYCKGTLSDEVIRALIARATAKNIPVLIDSKKQDWAIFKGALLAKPNMSELAVRTTLRDDQDAGQIEQAARALMAHSGIKNIIASRSENGMMFVTAEQAYHSPATARQAKEVSGAGDTVLAVCALAIAAGAALPDAVWLGNLAAGVAVEKDQTATISNEELRDAVLRCDPERYSA